MFEAALKGTRTTKTKKLKAQKWGAFDNKDANRWKKQGGVKNMISFRKLKKIK